MWECAVILAAHISCLPSGFCAQPTKDGEAELQYYFP
jgi:hypothetical protein